MQTLSKNFPNFYCEKLKDIFNKRLQENKFPGLIKKRNHLQIFPQKKIIVQSVLYSIL